MRLSRRLVLKGAGALPLLAGPFGLSAFNSQVFNSQVFNSQAFSSQALAQTAPGVAEIPPILFVHGNGDHAALWVTTLWRMESNGMPRDRMFAINFTDPLARSDDKVEQPNRSSTEDQ